MRFEALLAAVAAAAMSHTALAAPAAAVPNDGMWLLLYSCYSYLDTRFGTNGARPTDNVYAEMDYLISQKVYEEDIRNANVIDVLGK